YMQRVVSQLKRGSGAARVPVIVFTKGGAPWLERIAASGCDCVGLDWSVDLGEARRRIGAGAALQGNLDPAVLLASPEVVRREVQKALESFGSGAGHVFNLGHGVPQCAPPENVAALVAAVRELRPKFHCRTEKTQSCVWGAPDDSCTVLPGQPHHARSLAHSPAPRCNRLVHPLI